MSEAKGESEHITKEMLTGKNGLIESIKSLGMTTTIEQNFKDSIVELRSGQFSQVWIICGRGENRKLDKLTKNGTSYLIYDFIDRVIKFRENGDAIFISADNHPLNYELNIFLERVTLEGKKTKCRLDVQEDGCADLTFGDIVSNTPRIFDQRKTINCRGYERHFYQYPKNNAPEFSSIPIPTVNNTQVGYLNFYILCSLSVFISDQIFLNAFNDQENIDFRLSPFRLASNDRVS